MVVGANDVRAGGAFVEIGTDTRGVGRGLANVRQRLGRFVSDIGNVGKKLLIAGGVLGAPLVLAIKKASDFEETLSKFRAVFKEFTFDARAWAKAFAKDIGRGEGDVLSFMATVQDTFVPLGAARRDAFDLSKQVTQLAIDLASFNNMADTDVLALLQSALVGVHRSVRRFGVVITEATLNEQLMNDGIAEGSKAATELQKAQARLKLIISSTSDAMGDAARTSGGFANMMKRLRARIGDLGETVGKKLIPITKPYVKLVTDLINKVREWANENGALIQMVGRMVSVMTILGGAMVVVSKGLGVIWTTIKTVFILAPIIALADALGLIPESLREIVAEVKVGKQTLAEWVEPMKKALLDFWESVKKTGFGLFELVSVVTDFIISKALDVAIKLGEILAKIIDAAIKGILTGSGNAIKQVISQLDSERLEDPNESSEIRWKKWTENRLKELSILKKGVKNTFSGDKEVFEDLNRKLRALLEDYKGDLDQAIPRELKSLPGTFSSFRVAGVAAGGVDRALNNIAKNTAEIVKNTRHIIARAGD